MEFCDLGTLDEWLKLGKKCCWHDESALNIDGGACMARQVQRRASVEIYGGPRCRDEVRLFRLHLFTVSETAINSVVLFFFMKLSSRSQATHPSRPEA